MLGKQVRDKVTGFEGICTATAEYLFGCRQYGIAPKANKETGKVESTLWVDEGRVEIIGDGLTAAEVAGEKPRGPNRDAPGQELI